MKISEQVSGNNRNGTSSKTLKVSHGEVTIDSPRDREGSFEPQLVSKGQTRITGMDEQILTLYAKGMNTRDISATFKEMYGIVPLHSVPYFFPFLVAIARSYTDG